MNEVKEKQGALELREAADLILERDGVDIAEALGKSCKGGHIQSIKFLYELAELAAQLGECEGASKFRSLALRWAAEPEWPGKSREKDGEMSAISREPEA
jgi:hypothetical protein